MNRPVNLQQFEEFYLNYNGSGSILERSGKITFGCLMLFFEVSIWNTFLDQIDDVDLYKPKTHGKEKSPHLSIICGLRDKEITIDDVKNCIDKIDIKPSNLELDVKLKLSEVSFFDNPDFDVLKFDVKSSILNMLNVQIKELPHSELYAIYQPHVTIAYLKKGMGKKYKQFFNVQEDDKLDLSINKSRYVYSDSKFKEIII